MYYNSYELYHHGILGQKWGIRRFQNKDGSLKPAGEKRYYDNDSNGGSKSTSKKGNSTGSSSEHNKEYNQAKIARNIAIGAALVAGTAIAAYGASQYIKEHKDLVVSGGEALQRITTNEEGAQLYDNFYAAVGKHDMDRYKAFMPKYHLNGREEGEHLIKELRAKDTMKIASPANAAKVFEKLKADDPEFKKVFESAGAIKYDQFNMGICQYRFDDKMASNFNKFRDAMEKAGYAGVIDVNDRKYSGYNAKNPAIVFRNASAEIAAVSKLPRENLTAEKREDGKAAVEGLMNDKGLVVKSLAMFGGMMTAAAVSNQGVMNEAQNPQPDASGTQDDSKKKSA